MNKDSYIHDRPRKAMESSFASSDNGQLELAVQGIKGIIRENPLSGFEEFRTTLGDPAKIIEP